MRSDMDRSTARSWELFTMALGPRLAPREDEMEPEAAVDYLARRKEQDEAWVRCAPARAALHDARRLLIEAASIFYANGISNAGDKYKALADQIRHQGD